MIFCSLYGEIKGQDVFFFERWSLEKNLGMEGEALISGRKGGGSSI